MSKLFGAAVALALLWTTALPAAAQSTKPGSVEPATASEPTPVTSADGRVDKAEKKNVRTAKVRKHRYARYRYRRHGFLIPPPQYWFRPWPRYRYSRGHRRAYAGFPFFFRRW